MLTSQPFGTYTGAVVATQAAQDEVIANLNSLKALLADPAGDATKESSLAGAKVDWDMMTPRMATQLRSELDSIIAAVDGMPIA